MFYEIKNTLDQFVTNFNLHFYEYVFTRFIDNVQKSVDEKYQKYSQTCRSYHSQIKEIEYLIDESIIYY